MLKHVYSIVLIVVQYSQHFVSGDIGYGYGVLSIDRELGVGDIWHGYGCGYRNGSVGMR